MSPAETGQEARMSYEFQSTLYRTSAAMHAAIAGEWLTAGGLNNAEAIAQTLTETTDEALADEAISGWGLTETDEDGNRIMPDFDRAELVEAFQDLRKDFQSR